MTLAGSDIGRDTLTHSVTVSLVVTGIKSAVLQEWLRVDDTVTLPEGSPCSGNHPTVPVLTVWLHLHRVTHRALCATTS